MTLFPSDFPGSNAAGTRRSLDRFRAHWRSIVALGVVSALLGLAALVLTVSATLASVLIIGFFMAAMGAFEIVVGFRTRSWGRFLVWELAGLLYLVAGLFAIAAPEIASVVLTLMLGAGLIATGISRLVFGFQIETAPTRSALLLSGGVTALLGLLIVIGWPSNSAFILGTLLGIDLLFRGITWVVFGFRLRPQAG